MRGSGARGFLIAILSLLAFAVAALGPIPSMQAQANVTVVKGPGVNVRPGPDVLYALNTSPLLENAGIWKAAPIMTSGASAYRDGEFLYQDYLYDESGTYPNNPAYSTRNNADLVELRVRPSQAGTAVRVTLASMQEFAEVGVTIALGGEPTQPQAVPHGANARMPADVFVTVHGSSGDIVKGGVTLPDVPVVSIDTRRRQVDILIPSGAFNPGGRSVRLGAAVGLWDPSANAYRPQAGGAAFLNVAFRFAEPPGEAYPISWANARQTAALKSGNLSEFFATVDFTKLATNTNDDMPGAPGGVPQRGVLSRIYASGYEPQQGRSQGTSGVCRQPCTAVIELPGQLQPYSVSVPSTPPPNGGYALVYALHGCGMNYRPGAGPGRYSALDALVVYPGGRGGCHWWWGLSGADVFEAGGDVARHYPVNKDRVYIGGGSMGGYGTYRLSAQWPDLFAASAPEIGCAAAETGWNGPGAPPQSGEAAVVHRLAPSWRHIPMRSAIGVYDTACPTLANRALLDEMDRLGYRYEWYEYPAEHASAFELSRATAPDGPVNHFKGTRVVRDPARVTYVYSPRGDQKEFGLNADHAYWISGLSARTTSGPVPIGAIDLFSHGFGQGDPAVGPTERTSGVGYTVQRKKWGAGPDQPRRDALDIVATNISAITVDVARARLSCNPTITVAADGPITITLAGCKP